MLHTIEIEEETLAPNIEFDNNDEQSQNTTTYTSSFMVRPPNKPRELEIIKETL